MQSSAVSLSPVSSPVSSTFDALAMPGSFPSQAPPEPFDRETERGRRREREGSEDDESLDANHSSSAAAAADYRNSSLMREQILERDSESSDGDDIEPRYNGYAPVVLSSHALVDHQHTSEVPEQPHAQEPPAVHISPAPALVPQQQQQHVTVPSPTQQQQQQQSSKISRNAPYRASMRPPSRPPQKTPDELNSAFYTPVPLSGNPTDVLSNRFTVWRRVLKECISYFEEVAVFQDQRARSHLRLAGVVNVPFRDTGDSFLRRGGIQDTPAAIRDYHKQSSLHSADAAKQINEQVVPRLKDLRRDLSVKIKEIKGLSGDFKNSVAKELDLTKKQVAVLTEALGAIAVNPHLVAGKYDPYIVKLATEKQLRKQMDEENYLHQAYLNIENSGKALEEIVMKEIQQAFDTYCGFLQREGQDTLDYSHRLTTNVVDLPPSKEWTEFVLRDPNFVDPTIPVRKFDNIIYPGREDPATKPIRAGPLERRTKYLKSYTSAWYVLTPTYLHEFKTADRKNDLTPVMSLLLQDCQISDHSDSSSNSFKFLLKGKQSGQFHRGHSWMFRAENYEQMINWFNDIKKLTDGPPPTATVPPTSKSQNSKIPPTLDIPDIKAARKSTSTTRPSSEYRPRDFRASQFANSTDGASRASFDSASTDAPFR